MIRVLTFVLLAAVASVNCVNPAHCDDNRPRKKKSRFRDGPEVRGSGEKRVKEDGKTVIYKKKNTVDFDDSLIEGEVKNPNEFYFTVRPSGQGKNLVERRKNFHKEMLRDTVMIR